MNMNMNTTAATPQTAPLPGSGQVANNAGGFSHQLDDAQRLQRFLILGSDQGSYYAKSTALTAENVGCLDRMIAAGRGVEAVALTEAISVNGRAPKQTPTMRVLATCARCDDLQTKTAAYAALAKVCRIPTHLFEFLEAAEKASGAATGWGRAHRKAVGNWYNGKSPMALASAVTKYQQRNGWAHLDALRLAHPKPADDVHACVFTYIAKGLAAAAQAHGEQPACQGVLSFLRAVEAMKACTDEAECAKLIADHRLVREHVPTALLSSTTVWGSLLEQMPLGALIRNLGKMSSIGLLVDGSPAAALVAGKLNDVAALKAARVHPFSVLVAHKQYGAGRGEKGSLTWPVCQLVVGALDSAFRLSFQAVQPSGKRFCLALDVSGSMTWSFLGGGGGGGYGSTGGGTTLSAHQASAAMALVTLATEPVCEVMAFSDTFQPLTMQPNMSLAEANGATTGMSFGRTDCAQPMLWAMQQQKDFDCFVVYTDCETYAGSVHPCAALRQYRAALGIDDAKLIVVGMSSNGFTIADPSDPGMLDVVGFDAAAPGVMSDFVAGLV